MRKIFLAGVFVFLTLISIIFLIYSKSQSSIIGYAILSVQNEEKLEQLRTQVNVECIKNSHCSEGFECIENTCVNANEINKCEKVKLSTDGTPLTYLQSINSVREILIDHHLSYLLSDGKIFNNGSEIDYIQVVKIGSNTINKESGEFLIENKSPIYTYKLIFSIGVNFSDPYIQGQVLKILGEEYIIGEDSNNSRIELIKDNKKIKIENGKIDKNSDLIDDIYTNVVRRNDNTIESIEISFYSPSKIKHKVKFSENIFDNLILEFDKIEDGGRYAEIFIGGDC